MFPNPYPELSANRLRQPVPLPDDGAPPAGRPITIYDEDDLPPAVREEGNYAAAKRTVKRLPRKILGYAFPYVGMGIILLLAAWNIAGAAMEGSESVAFSLAKMGFIVLFPGFLIAGLAFACRKRLQLAFRVWIGLFPLSFVAAVGAVLIALSLVSEISTSQSSVLFPGLLDDPRLYLVLLLFPLAAYAPFSLLGLFELDDLIRAGRALSTVERHEAPRSDVTQPTS